MCENEWKYKFSLFQILAKRVFILGVLYRRVHFVQSLLEHSRPVTMSVAKMFTLYYKPRRSFPMGAIVCYCLRFHPPITSDPFGKLALASTKFYRRLVKCSLQSKNAEGFAPCVSCSSQKQRYLVQKLHFPITTYSPVPLFPLPACKMPLLFGKNTFFECR